MLVCCAVLCSFDNFYCPGTQMQGPVIHTSSVSFGLVSRDNETCRAGLATPEADNCASTGKKHAAVAGCRGLVWGWLLWLGSVLWELHFLIIKTQDAVTVALVGFVSYTCSTVARFHFLIIKVFWTAVWVLTWKKLLEWSALQQQRRTPRIVWSLDCFHFLPALFFLLKTNITAPLDADYLLIALRNWLQQYISLFLLFWNRFSYCLG